MQILKRKITLKEDNKINDLKNFRVDVTDGCRLGVRVPTNEKTGEDMVINFTADETAKIRRCLNIGRD